MGEYNLLSIIQMTMDVAIPTNIEAKFTSDGDSNSAVGCGLRIPSRGGRCYPWKPQSSDDASRSLNREPVVICVSGEVQSPV